MVDQYIQNWQKEEKRLKQTDIDRDKHRHRHRHRHKKFQFWHFTVEVVSKWIVIKNQLYKIKNSNLSEFKWKWFWINGNAMCTTSVWLYIFRAGRRSSLTINRIFGFLKRSISDSELLVEMAVAESTNSRCMKTAIVIQWCGVQKVDVEEWTAHL